MYDFQRGQCSAGIIAQAIRRACTFTSEFRMLKEAPHAPRGYVYASMMLLAGQVAAIPFVASIPST